jgi:hypothetical protein
VSKLRRSTASAEFFEKIRKMGGIYVKKDGKVKNSMIT